MDELRDLVARHAGAQATPTAMRRVAVFRSDHPTTPLSTLYEPILCVVLQGVKRAIIGDRVMTYDAANYFAATVDVPVTGEIVEATPQRPYLVAALTLDPATIAAVLLDMRTPPAEPAGFGFGVSPMTPDLTDAWTRMLRLADRPDDVAMLAPMLEREILYRVLRGPLGGTVAQMARADGRVGQIRRAIARIRRTYDTPFLVDDVAAEAGMSVSSFHRHFKAVTAMSPIQYQKQLRLQEARRLLLSEAADATGVAFAVGYESASQFSREYARQFGAPPARDAARLRQGYGAEAVI